jgi:hypothetical protein
LIRDAKFGAEIRDKHPGSETLLLLFVYVGCSNFLKPSLVNAVIAYIWCSMELVRVPLAPRLPGTAGERKKEVFLQKKSLTNRERIPC